MCLSKLLAEKNLTKARRINRSGFHMAIVYKIKFPIINDTSSLEFNKHICGKRCLLIFFPCFVSILKLRFRSIFFNEISLISYSRWL